VNSKLDNSYFESTSAKMCAVKTELMVNRGDFVVNLLHGKHVIITTGTSECIRSANAIVRCTTVGVLFSVTMF
jgi:hypothetical protein